MIFKDLTHSSYQKNLKSFLKKDVLPFLESWEELKVPVKQVIKKMYSEGLLCMSYPKKYGGYEESVYYHLILAEELGKLPYQGLALALTIHHDMVLPLLIREGINQAIAKIIKEAIQGNKILSHAVTEQQSGTDLSKIQTIARKVEKGYIVNGTKCYVTNGLYCDFLCTLVLLENNSLYPLNTVLLLIPRLSEGVVVTKKHNMLGYKSCDIVDITFNNVFVDQCYRIGEDGLGLITQIEQFEKERIISSFRATSVGESILRATKTYMNQRITFGTTLMQKQSLAHKVSHMFCNYFISTAINYYSGKFLINNDRVLYSAFSLISKFVSNQLVTNIARECLHLHGAAGYLRSHYISNIFCESKLFSISTGSNEVMLGTLVKSLILQDKRQYFLKKLEDNIFNQSNNYKSYEIQVNIFTNWLLENQNLLDSFNENAKLLFSKMNAYGLFNPFYQESKTISFRYEFIFLRELCRLPTGNLGMAVATNIFIIKYIILKYYYIEEILSKNPAPIFSLAITEHSGGSDIKNVNTVATITEDGFRLNGTKMYISNACYADFFVVLAKVEINGNIKLALFIVPSNLDGVHIKEVDTLGNKGVLGEIFLKNVYLNSSHIISEVDHGLFIMLNIFKFERLMIAVRASQTALVHLEELIAWCKQRILSGSDLMQKQSIQFKISELYCEIIGVISQTYLCMELIESKKNCEKEILIAKYTATSILEKLCDFSMQMYAAEGYKNDSHCAKLFCDSTALSLAGGSNEILLDSLVKIFLQESNQ